jgi:hypothetical protein
MRWVLSVLIESVVGFFVVDDREGGKAEAPEVTGPSVRHASPNMETNWRYCV